MRETEEEVSGAARYSATGVGAPEPGVWSGGEPRSDIEEAHGQFVLLFLLSFK